MTVESDPNPVETVELFGVTIHNVTRDQLFQLIEDRIAKRTPGYIVTPNVNHLCRFQDDAAFRETYRDSFLVLADGVPVLWASRLLGKPIREKVSGSDLTVWLAERFNVTGHSLFLLGAAPGVADEAARVFRQRHPNLTIAGTYCPPMGFENDPDEIAKAIACVRAAQPDVCLVALGSPKQEWWMHQHGEACGAPVMIGIGASLDFVAGALKRAPRWMQKTGTEWLWRVLTEPRRLWRRYFDDGRLFLALLWREWRKKKTPPAA